MATTKVEAPARITAEMLLEQLRFFLKVEPRVEPGLLDIFRTAIVNARADGRESVRTAPAPSADVVPTGVTATCAHCHNQFITWHSDAALCARCFIAGHRGFVCGKYCVVTSAGEALAAAFGKDYAVTPSANPRAVTPSRSADVEQEARELCIDRLGDAYTNEILISRVARALSTRTPVALSIAII